MIKKIIKFTSKISVRLMLFNILVVIIPIASLFYLDVYEKKLLNAQEHAMVQQGRIMASALTNKNINFVSESQNIISNLKRRQEARIRVIDINGLVVADSSLSQRVVDDFKELPPSKLYSRISNTESKSNDRNFLYSIVRNVLDIARYFLRGPKYANGVIEYYSGRNMLDGKEVKAALDGRYGATTRISTGGQRSITMYSAIPVYNNGHVYAVVLVSQSTYRILQNLYQIRLEIFKTFLVCLFAAMLISFILSRTIAGPLKKLRNQAKELTDSKGRIKTHFKNNKRMDEIGELNDSLEELTKKLHTHLLKTEAFASDVSHEFKNPLASIQSATEILKDSVGVDGYKFIDVITQEVRRLERLITGVREISAIDVKLGEEEYSPFDPFEVTKAIVDNYRLKCLGRELKFSLIKKYTGDFSISISPNRFVQVIENILSNAVSFSLDYGLIEVVFNIGDSCNLEISVLDSGPGIPEENLDKLFNRFFTYRTNKNLKDRNSGLGLSICEAIIKGYGGTIIARNRSDQGAEFTISIPGANALIRC